MSYIKKCMQFKVGYRIAQLLLLPYVKGKTTLFESTGVFGRTGRLFFFQNISDDKRPKSKLNDIEIESLMGIDSDLTITSRESEIPH